MLTDVLSQVEQFVRCNINYCYPSSNNDVLLDEFDLETNAEDTFFFFNAQADKSPFAQV